MLPSLAATLNLLTVLHKNWPTGKTRENLSLTQLNIISFRTKRVHGIIFHTCYVMTTHQILSLIPQRLMRHNFVPATKVSMHK